MDAVKMRLRRSNSFCPNTSVLRVLHHGADAAQPTLPESLTPRESAVAPPLSPEFNLKVTRHEKLALVYDSDDARDHDNQCESEKESDDTDSRVHDCHQAAPRRKVAVAGAAGSGREKRLPRRRSSSDARSLATQNTTTSLSGHSHGHVMNNTNSTVASSNKLSGAQKRGCFQYIKRRHSIAMDFASTASNNSTTSHSTSDGHEEETHGEALGSHWEFVKAKHGVEIFKSSRSRCEIRGVTRVNASVKNVMSLLAAGESTESFVHAQNILLGRDQVLEARVLASCVPSSASRYFHCGLKYMAMKNPFGLHPLDLVFLDYTDVSTTPDDKLIGYRILESIRVPEFRSVPKYIRASIRCEVYIVRETNVPGVVEVTFASHLDPKSKYSASKRHAWLDQIVVRLTNLRSYAEKASFSHRMLLEKGKLVKGETRHHCFVCEINFSFLRKRHNCRLCGEVTCGRCSRKLPVFVGTETTRVRVCLGCMIQSRHQPDELGRLEVVRGRRNSIGNQTYIAYDEIEDVCEEEQEV